MKIASSYVHSLNGRLRIKIDEVKGSSTKALELEERLSIISGIEYLKVNPTTGNILILYDPHKIFESKIIDLLRKYGYLQQSGNTDTKKNYTRRSSRVITKTLINSLGQHMLEIIIQNLIQAMI